MTLITEKIPRALGVLGQKQRRRPNIYFLLKNHNITLLTQCVQILSFQRVISVKCFRVLPWARLALSSKCGVFFLRCQHISIRMAGTSCCAVRLCHARQFLLSFLWAPCSTCLLFRSSHNASGTDAAELMSQMSKQRQRVQVPCLRTAVGCGGAETRPWGSGFKRRH